MNYIKSLENKVAAQEKQLKAINEEISLFMVYLASPKFCGENTTIQSEEVFIRMREIRMMTLPE